MPQEKRTGREGSAPDGRVPRPMAEPERVRCAPVPKKSFARMVGEYSSLATILPASILVGYGIGYYLDKYFGTHFWYLVWLLIGIAAGMRDLVRKVFVDFPKDVDNSDDAK